MIEDRLSTGDVSYAKLLELQERLLAATLTGEVKWETSGHGYRWCSRHGVVDVSPGVFMLWDDNGNRLRCFQPETDALHDAAIEQHNATAAEVIERIMVELDSRLAACPPPEEEK